MTMINSKKLLTFNFKNNFKDYITKNKHIH